MRILITGADGQLGRSLRQALTTHDVIALAHSELDVSDRTSVEAALGSQHPDAVIHTAALTDTARCEREPKLAYAVNASGAENIARACAASGARCIAVSTNEVFDGNKRSPYEEPDRACALNAYGASKLSGERLALAANPDACIVRTSWVYGESGANFVEKVLSAAKSGRSLTFVADEVATPTHAGDLARSLCSLVEAGSSRGIYHLTNSGHASRYEWAREILRLAHMDDVEMHAVTSTALRASGYDGPVKPPYSVLANTRALALGISLRPWREALATYFAGVSASHEVASDV